MSLSFTKINSVAPLNFKLVLFCQHTTVKVDEQQASEPQTSPIWPLVVSRDSAYPLPQITVSLLHDKNIWFSGSESWSWGKACLCLMAVGTVDSAEVQPGLSVPQSAPNSRL